jgi:mRNA-degrading endonuclease HigB of HigAB toxin-antitoxin module
MKIVGALGLRDVIARSEPSLAGAIAAWHAEVSAADWSSAADLSLRHPSAVAVGATALFDLGHHDHCVIIRINYEMRSVLMKYIGPRADAPWPQPRAKKTKAGS